MNLIAHIFLGVGGTYVYYKYLEMAQQKQQALKDLRKPEEGENSA